jgi:hypothetical protein
LAPSALEEMVAASEALEFVSIRLDPVTCEVEEPLPTHLTLRFHAKSALSHVKWRVHFMLDVADQQKVLSVAETDAAVSYEKGESTLQMQLVLDLSQISKSVLLNLGLLMISAVDEEGTDLFNMSVVTQIEGDRSGGPLKRVFLDPQ